MTTIRDLYGLVKARVKETGLNSFDYVPGSAEWGKHGAAFVLPAFIEDEGAADDWQILRFDVVVLVSAAFDVNQLKLIPYQEREGTQSIRAAFARDPSLGSPEVHARVAGSRTLGLEEQAGYQGFGAVFEIVVRLG